MRRTVLTAVLLGLLATTAPSAHATPDYHWTGGCGFTVFNDTTPGGQLGGRNVWNGEVDIVAIATNEHTSLPTPLAPISVQCELRVNSVSQGIVLSATGLGVAANAATLQFTALPSDYVEICDIVTVATDSHAPVCYGATLTQHPPQPVLDVFYTLWDLVRWQVLTQLDPLICPLISTLAPGIGPVTVDPTGDVDVYGEPIYDCPPYHGNQYWPWPLYVLEHHHLS